jgi:uncharacterized protein (TIGR02594 family)
MTWARAQIGTREASGPANNPRILNWAQKLGAKVLGVSYAADATPWCGLFCAAALAAAGHRPPPIAVRARQWALWGQAADPCVGAVMVFSRDGGGHVGFYEGERADAYLVLGGNQSDAVSRAWISRERCVAIRWPHGEPRTKSKTVPSAGVLSLNEA